MSKRSQQIDAFFRQGQQLHMAGRLAEAEHIYRQVLAAMPLHAEALHAPGALALQSGQPVVAETLLVHAIGVKPSADFQITLANTLLALNRPDDAAQTARQVLRARPQNAEAHQVLGHAISDGGHPDQAIGTYRTALRLKPGLPDIRNNLGLALRQANRLAEAEQELRQAPADPEALVNLSNVQKERGAFAEAEETLRQALRLTPENPVLRYNWSLLMHLLGRTQEARDGWEQRFRAGAIPARANAANELSALRQAAGSPPGTAELEAAPIAVNTRLWRIEDLIREMEKARDFGPGFVALARAVYHENDERGRIKLALNRVLRSALVEEKQYSVY